MKKEEILKFLKKLIIISVPIILQQLFLNLASLLDTIMVGQLDEISVSGVYIATQILFVVNLMVFGSVEGATVYFSQYFGKNDVEHMRNVYCFKFIASLFISIIATLVLAIFGRNLVGLFIDDINKIDVAMKYLDIVLFSIIPYAISVTLSTTLREYHRAVAPMIITLICTVINFVINYVTIFGKWGFPCLGPSGAALGTLVDRILELIILAIYMILNKYPFQENFFKGFKISKDLFVHMILKSIPLCVNETLWSLSQTVLVYFFTQCDTISTISLPIVQTIFNLMIVVLLGLGNGFAILVGNTVGKGDFKEAQKQAYISLLFTLVTCVILGAILILSANGIVSLYKGVNIDAQHLAAFLIKFNGIYIIFYGINTALFFLLRAGGRTEVVFFFDSFYGWIISIPFCYIIQKTTSISLKDFYVLVYSLDVLKTIVGMILLLSKKWYKNLTITKEDIQTKKEGLN